MGRGTSMTVFPSHPNGIFTLIPTALAWTCVVVLAFLFVPMPSMVFADSGNAVSGDWTSDADNIDQERLQVNVRTTGYGIDPATACTDANGNGQISPDECQGRDWNWMASDPQIPLPSECTDTNGDGRITPDEITSGNCQVVGSVNTQNGANVPIGSSPATFQQSYDQIIKSGPHLTVRNYNKPSMPNSTATAGVTSTSNGSLRDLHNEYGFDIVVDKKTDPLEPYYQRFQENYAVDAQQDINGNMVGQAGITYEKIVTEEDPTNPGVFNRYTVTGTATSGGLVGSYSSQCQSGCSTDPETNVSHPWQ